MNELELQQFRIERLQQAIRLVAQGNASEFGRRLGYRDGAFVRQMLAGRRPVSEKTIRAIEALPGLKSWFAPDRDDAKGLADRVGEPHAGRDLFERYMRAPAPARALVDLLLKAPGEAAPEWATGPVQDLVKGMLALVDPLHQGAARPRRAEGRGTDG
ncbi:hypothetical protein GCM10023144_29610 [Pigmentiphaga soli]|uniref:XRE family transcriptional regulator n=1 Tax=Pigmentiphaga soli TaxID=1007095 RepID=A0ABP8H8J0_9BURK